MFLAVPPSIAVTVRRRPSRQEALPTITMAPALGYETPGSHALSRGGRFVIAGVHTSYEAIAVCGRVAVSGTFVVVDLRVTPCRSATELELCDAIVSAPCLAFKLLCCP